jgi:hypothetical protein
VDDDEGTAALPGDREEVANDGHAGDAGEPPVTISPLPRVWIGFVLAAAFLAAEFMEDDPRHPQGAGPFAIAAVAGFFWLYCVHRFHQVLGELTTAPGVRAYSIKPIQAVGYHFLPIFAVVWLFRWPAILADYVNSHSSARMAPGLLLGAAFVCGLLAGRFFDGAAGLTVVFLATAYIAAKLRVAVVEHERLRRTAQVFT